MVAGVSPGPGSADGPAAHVDGDVDVAHVDRPLTILEAVARRAGVPHLVVVMAVALLLGLPILPYADPRRETHLFTSVFLPHFGLIHGLLDALYQGLLVALIVFSPLATSFMLDRVWRTPTDAPWLRQAIQPEVAATVVSGRDVWPPLLLGSAAVLPMLVQYLGGNHVRDTSDAVVMVLEVAIVLSRFAVLFMFIWTYIRSLLGLSRICAVPLGLLPSYVDRWLGARPLGSLALALAIVYSTGLALGVPIVTSGPAAAVMGPVLIGLSLLGLLLFFLPLRSAHRQMAAEKANEQAWLRARLASVAAVSRHQPDPVPRDPTTALHDVIAMEIIERHVGDIRTWPIDTSIAAKLLTTIALPLTLTLIGRQLVLTVLGV